MLKINQIGLNLIKIDQSCSNMFKLDQSCSNLLKLDETILALPLMHNSAKKNPLMEIKLFLTRLRTAVFTCAVWCKLRIVCTSDCFGCVKLSYSVATQLLHLYLEVCPVHVMSWKYK